MFKKPSLDEIEKMLVPLRNNSYFGNSDYQRLRQAGSNYRGLSGLFAIQFIANSPFSGSSWRIAGDIFSLTVIISFWIIGSKYRRAIEVLEEACPISLDDVRKKTESTS
ncbi:MAG: hypothetical protein V4507_04695 [Verrucomicrobiota bacterium]